MIWTTEHPFHHPNTHAWGAFALHRALTLNRPEHKIERWINPSILACLHYRTYDTYLRRTTYASLKGSMNPSFLHRPVALFRADARPWWTPGIFPQQCWMKDFCRSFCCCIIVCLPGFWSKWRDSMSLLTAVQIRTQRSLKPWIK